MEGSHARTPNTRAQMHARANIHVVACLDLALYLGSSWIGVLSAAKKGKHTSTVIVINKTTGHEHS
eukprot:10365448-Lingulodinium_polyedra.AAC.1